VSFPPRFYFFACLRLFSLWTKMTRTLCLLSLIDWLAWSFVVCFFENLDGSYDPRTYRSISVHLLIHSLFQVSNLPLHLIHLSVTTSSLLHFLSNEWKSLVFSLISIVSFLFLSIDYIAWYVDWSIYVFGLFGLGKKFLLSFIYHALDLIDACFFGILKIFIKVLYVKDSFCILWKEEHHSSLLKRKYCISSVIEKLESHHNKHWKWNESSFIVKGRLSAFRTCISERFHSLIVALIVCSLSLN